jgi:hypothetical protein
LSFQLQVKDKEGKTDYDSVDVKIGCYVDIWVSAFLPPWTDKGRIPNPAPINNYVDENIPLEHQYRDYHEFSTDKRNTPQKDGSARLWSYIVVDICNGIQPLVKKLHGIGESHGYRYTYKDNGLKLRMQQELVLRG